MSISTRQTNELTHQRMFQSLNDHFLEEDKTVHLSPEDAHKSKKINNWLDKRQYCKK